MRGDRVSNYDNNTALLTKIAWLYYVQGLTHGEIAQKLGFSRPTVTRHLAKAKELGIVEIKIAKPYRTCFDVGESLKNRFGLTEVIVVPSGNELAETKKGVGKACSDYLEETLVNGDILGIAWGTTIYEVGKYLQLKKPLDLTVVQLMGGLNTSEKINPEEIVKLIASQLNATGIWLNTPAIVGSAAIKKALLSDIGVKSVLTKAKGCSKCLLGLGDVGDESSLVMSNALTPADMAQMRTLGAVGNILSWFYDQNGTPIDSYISQRIIAVTLADIKQIPIRIGVTAGTAKTPAVLGAIRGGYINVLITDEETALDVLRF
jgi:deoxyribonucleoside regulator